MVETPFLLAIVLTMSALYDHAKSWLRHTTVAGCSYPLLHLTAGLGQTAASQALLKLGADVHNSSNEEEVTALHAAALGASLTDAALLLKAGEWVWTGIFWS